MTFLPSHYFYETLFFSIACNSSSHTFTICRRVTADDIRYRFMPVVNCLTSAFDNSEKPSNNLAIFTISSYTNVDLRFSSQKAQYCVKGKITEIFHSRHYLYLPVLLQPLTYRYHGSISSGRSIIFATKLSKMPFDTTENPIPFLRVS